MLRRFSLLLAAALTACGGDPEQLITAPQVELTERVRTHFSSIEVLEVSLPSYASGENVAVIEEGSLILSEVLWADDPTRAVTLSLARNLKELTRVRVAPEPWPFDGFADARVDVRVEELVMVGGVLRLSGQYFVADLLGEGRDHAHLFDLSTPLPVMSAQATALGRARLVAELARDIAKTGL